MEVISFVLIGISMQVDENLGHSFQKINVDQPCSDASDNNSSSMVELVNVQDDK